ncbi:Outer-membrane lipoprotein LolB [Rhodocyclaceae bacterium]|nr:Outer-membrane lipoprotein LolB [Rhodocyclaceae bacterium]
MRGLLCLIVLVLAGCASAPLIPQTTARPEQAETKPFALTGRIAVKHNSERSSAGVRWAHQITEDEILLLAPLGQTVARIRRDAQGVSLDTSDRHYTAQDTEELTHRVLGWQLPLAGLRNWVLALPAAQSEASIERDANGQVSVMRQDGWEIHYTRYATQASDSLPLRMILQREGMEIQLLIDEWEIQ